jgi:hypothetical protein
MLIAIHRKFPNRILESNLVIPTEVSAASESGGSCFGGALTTPVLPAKKQVPPLRFASVGMTRLFCFEAYLLPHADRYSPQVPEPYTRIKPCHPDRSERSERKWRDLLWRRAHHAGAAGKKAGPSTALRSGRDDKIVFLLRSSRDDKIVFEVSSTSTSRRIINRGWRLIRLLRWYDAGRHCTPCAE